MPVVWLKFIVSAAAVIFCGYRLCIYGEKIARIVHIGRGFVGFIFLAAITSLPELAVSLSATKIGALDLALGDLLGSNLFNLTIVAIILLFFVQEKTKIQFDSMHLISSSFSVLLICLVGIGIAFYSLVNPQTGYSPFFLDAESALIVLTYLFGAYLIFRSERAKQRGLPALDKLRSENKAAVWIRFLSLAVVLVGLSIYLCLLADQIAQVPIGGRALGGTFVGGLFLAIITSLPEMAVSISAAKLGFMDMALGNIFGSNMFNMLIVPVIDLAFGPKVILSCVSNLHLFTVLFVLISTGLVVAGLSYRSRKKTPALAWDSAAILFVYFAANLVNFYLR